MNKCYNLKIKEQQRIFLIQQQHIELFNQYLLQLLLEKCAQKEFEKIQMRKKIRRMTYLMLKYKKKLAKMKRSRRKIYQPFVCFSKIGFFVEHSEHLLRMNYTLK